MLTVNDDRGNDELAETGKVRHRVNRIASEAVYSVGAKRLHEGCEAAEPSARRQEMYGAIAALKNTLKACPHGSVSDECETRKEHPRDDRDRCPLKRPN
jgi:hypothetical protein